MTRRKLRITKRILKANKALSKFKLNSDRCSSLLDCDKLIKAFIWERTPEGHTYWCKLYTQIEQEYSLGK